MDCYVKTKSVKCADTEMKRGGARGAVRHGGGETLRASDVDGQLFERDTVTLHKRYTSV